MRSLKLDSTSPIQIGTGINFPVVKLVEILSHEDWEAFTEEYASSVTEYHQAMRFTGPGDMGRDIVGFVTDKFFDGPWDNYQCKRYGDKLTPSDVWVELGKIIYYTHVGEFGPPRHYYFAASKDIGLKLKKLLTKPDKLKAELIANWDEHCKNGIMETIPIPLEGELKKYLDGFDFTIFKAKTVVEMINGHFKTVFYARRFGTAGIPERPKPDAPPSAINVRESRYVKQLLQAYAEKLKTPLNDVQDLWQWPEMEVHFNRAREVFYHAESLRNFARDSVYEGAFDAVRDEIYHGVVDTYEMDYADGLTRIRATATQAASITPTCNVLCVRVQTQDKQGICHHLANDDRFIWVKNNA